MYYHDAACRGSPPPCWKRSSAIYQCITTTLHVGDCVLLTSDGLIEATNADDKLFGFHRLEPMFANAPQSDAYGILKYFQRMLRNFVGECAPHDDLTIIVAQISAGENT